MEELREKASSYADENVINVLKEAFARVYADGYRDGYKDCQDHVSVNLRVSNTEYIDLGLPSGTLWSADYEKEGDSICYMTYDDASHLAIPTKRQWDELLTKCHWKLNNKETIYECIGPNGKVLKFKPSGYIETDIDIVYLPRTYFWYNNNEGGASNYNTAVIWGNVNRKNVQKFKGFKIPVRLVKTKT